MFSAIFQHELKHWSRQPMVYVFGGILFGLALLTMWGMAAEGGEGPTPEILNSPYRINFMSNYLSLLMLFILPAIMGGALFRDYSSRMYTLLYAYPITKNGYLGAKFLSAWLTTALIVSLLGLGFIIGTQLPGTQAEVLRPFSWWPYAQLYFIFLWPNLWVFGALIFLVIIKTRNMYLAFMAIILLVAFQGMVGAFFTGDTGRYLAALLDPTGDAAVKYVVRYWPQAQRDSALLPIGGLILYNRLLWLAVALVLGIWAYRSFAFQQFVAQRSGTAQRDTAQNASTRWEVFPMPRYRYDLKAQLQTAGQVARTEARFIVWSWPFAALLLAGFLLVYFQQQQMNPQHGFALLPTTARMLRIPLFIFSLIINLITFLYTGVLIHRGQLTRMGPLLDICPQPNWVFMLGRWGAILLVQLTLLTLVMLGGVLAQTSYGYFTYEWGHYLFELFGLHFIHFAIWACLAVFIHSLFKNMYLGFFMLLLVPVALLGQNTIADFLDWPLLKEALTQFNAVPGVVVGFDYSDLNGYGHILPVYALYKIYWSLAGIGLLLLGLAVWQRELFFEFKERKALISSSIRGKLGKIILTVGTLFMGVGGFIFYQSHFISQTYFTETQIDQLLAKQELDFGHLALIPQPRIYAARINMDLSPATQDYLAEGELLFVNKTNQFLDTLLVFRSLKDSVKFDIQAAHEVLVSDPLVRLDIIRLSHPLAQGDTLAINFVSRNYPNSLLHHNSRILANGTYLMGHILPKLEWRDAYVEGKEKRAKYGLEPRKKADRLPSDSSLLGYEFAGNGMGRIHFETIVSTSAPQRAFSMGNLQRQWEADGRRYFHYQSEGLVPNDICWLSGEYERKLDSIPGHRLEIYHHPGHDHNYPNLLQGLKSSLQAGAEWYAPLDHPVFRLIEFPLTEGSHATLQGNLIPFSEALFLCDVDATENKAVDMPFFIAAHEVGHYWWGHRVDPANVRGGKILTEALADYHAIKVMEHHFGKEKARQFLGRMHETYLRERAASGEEYPLITAKLDQEFLNYRKGSLVMYALSEYLGENKFHQLLGDYERTRRFAEPPFPTSLDFVAHLRTYVPDSLAHLPHDLLETITLYDLGINEAATKAVPGGFQTRLQLQCRKFRSSAHGAPHWEEGITSITDTAGNRSLPLREYVQINLYGSDRPTGSPVLIETQTLAVSAITSELRLFSDQRPAYVLVDPYYRMIDPERTDNRWDFKN